MIKEYWKIKTVVAFLLCTLWVVPMQAEAIEYDHEIKLKNMSFTWKIQPPLLLVKLTALTKGWVGIGFNPSQRMQDANFVLGYVKNGNVKTTDAHGIGPKKHVDDVTIKGRNDVTTVSGSEQGGLTTIEFAIPMESGDSVDGKISRAGFNTVLLAYGKGRDNFRSRHRFRTSLKIDLSTGKYQ